MQYFKHYSTASDGSTINHLYDKFGHSGIAWYWLLVELCAEKYDSSGDPKFDFHPRIVRQKLRTTQRKVGLFLEECSTLLQLSFQITPTKVSITFPLIVEIKTTRKVIKNNKKQLMVYIDKDKDKDQEIEGLNPLIIITLYNKILSKKLEKYEFEFLSPNALSDLIILTGYPNFSTEEKIEEYFKKVLTVPFLIGKTDKDFKASLIWLLKPENAIKIMSNFYGKGSSVDYDLPPKDRK